MRLGLNLQAHIKKPVNKGLVLTAKTMGDFLIVLAKMENNGIHIDSDALEQVEKDFQDEFNKLRVEIDEKITF